MDTLGTVIAVEELDAEVVLTLRLFGSTELVQCRLAEGDELLMSHGPTPQHLVHGAFSLQFDSDGELLGINTL